MSQSQPKKVVVVQETKSVKVSGSAAPRVTVSNPGVNNASVSVKGSTSNAPFVVLTQETKTVKVNVTSVGDAKVVAPSLIKSRLSIIRVPRKIRY